MIALNRGAFDYLESGASVVRTYLSKSPTQVRYTSWNGTTVVVSGIDLLLGDGFNPSGLIDSITWLSPAGTQLARIEGLAYPAYFGFRALEEGTSLPRLLAGPNEIAGGAGDDTIEGFNGNDTIHGNAGNDLLGGGSGDDVIVGGTGNDDIWGGAGLDTAVFAGPQSSWQVSLTPDTITVRSLADGSVDTLHSVEYLRFDSGTVSIYGLAGITLTGGSGNDDLIGTPGRDTLNGGAGDDYLYSKGGNDLLVGGTGNDNYLVPWSVRIVEDANAGADRINLTAIGTGDYVLPDHIENFGMLPTSRISLVGNDLANRLWTSWGEDVVSGKGGDDFINGNDSADRLYGDGGNDRLMGASGNDTLDGGEGNDVLEGGGGADTLIGGAGDDRLLGEAIGAEGREASGLPTATREHLADSPAPNILFISIDDLAPVSQIFNHPLFNAITPNFDAFFARATTFVNAQAAVPLCNASRAAVLYGVGSDTSGIHTNDDTHLIAREQFPSLVRFMNEAGYYTVSSGKVFHDLGDRGDSVAFAQRFAESPSSDWQPASWVMSQSDVFTTVNEADLPDDAFADARSVSYLESFLQQTLGQPFFFAFGTYRPHSPLHVPQEYYDLYPLESIPVPDYGDADLGDLGEMALAFADLVNPGFHWSAGTEPGLTGQSDPVEVQKMIQGYLAAVSYADAVFGQVMAALSASAYADNTAIVFWSDHGFHLGEKQHFAKFTLWEEGARSPLAVMLPGGAHGGQVVAAPVSLLDIYPTVADLIGRAAPGYVEGHSLLGLIENPSAAWTRPAVTEMYGNYSVRTDTFRYILYSDGAEELYNHNVDAQEHNNLARYPGYAAVMANLRTWIPGGNDLLDGGAGDDWLYGGPGEDLLIGGIGNDTLVGGTGDDGLIGGTGADAMDGGAGLDTASYAGDEGAVFVNLSLGLGFGNAAQGDTYTGIENATGSAANDFLIGDPGINRLDGGPGDDRLIGGLGPDAIVGGTGSDTASYEDNSGTVFINLTLARGFNNAAEGDLYVGIENLVGGLFDDFFIGDDGANRLEGAMGADTLVGAGGRDSFVFTYAPGATSPFGSANVDTILDFRSGEDRIELSRVAFAGLGSGIFPAAALVLGTAAADAGDRIVYDQATGRLWFDADGAGGVAQVLFAVLENKPALLPSDIVVA